MNKVSPDENSLSLDAYWKDLGRVIISSDISAFAACLGWIMYWLDHIPDHVIHFHGFSWFLFIVSLAAAGNVAVILYRSEVKLGSRGDRAWHLFEITYSILASISGLAANFLNPPF